MKLLSDIGRFISSLTFADLVFFFAVLVLMILVVTLIYFIKINQDEPSEDTSLEETAEMKIAREISKSIENEEAPNIEFTDYEKDQENKAIISYEELLKKTNDYELNYENEEHLDDVVVKKVDLDNLVSLKDKKEERPKVEVRVISYAEEEAFLKTLKILQKNLG